MTKEQNLKNRLLKLLPKNFDEINGFFRELEAGNKLPEDLQEKLKSIGNTPLEEPEFAKAFEEGIETIELPFHFFTEEELSKMNQDETNNAVLFSQLATRKIMEYRYKNGNLKSTPAIEDMRYPNMVEIRKLRSDEKAQKETEEILHKFYENIEEISEPDREQMLELEDKIEKLEEKATEKLLNFAQLPSNATKWEKDLAKEILSQYIKGIAQGTPMGKQY